jgi:hypothetical protein
MIEKKKTSEVSAASAAPIADGGCGSKVTPRGPSPRETECEISRNSPASGDLCETGAVSAPAAPGCARVSLFSFLDSDLSAHPGYHLVGAGHKTPAQLPISRVFKSFQGLIFNAHAFPLQTQN